MWSTVLYQRGVWGVGQVGAAPAVSTASHRHRTRPSAVHLKLRQQLVSTLLQKIIAQLINFLKEKRRKSYSNHKVIW